jgi:Ca2+-binding RTX toxin-like protein
MELLFLFAGLGGVLAFTVFNSGTDAEDEEQLDVERDDEGRYILRGTSGSDTISPTTIDDAQAEVRALDPTARLAQIQASAGDDQIFANAEPDPRYPDRILFQDGLEINGGAGNDLILSVGTVTNQLWGGPGNDTLVGVGADMRGGDGDDLIVARSYSLGVDAQTHILRGNQGDDTIAVLNGFANISGGPGADRYILEYNRPSDEDDAPPDLPLENGFPGIGNVLINDFDMDEDQLYVVLPPLGSDNVEIDTIARVGDATVITLRVDVAPSELFPDGTRFRAQIALEGVDAVDSIELGTTTEGVILTLNAPPVPPTLPPIPAFGS